VHCQSLVCRGAPLNLAVFTAGLGSRRGRRFRVQGGNFWVRRQAAEPDLDEGRERLAGLRHAGLAQDLDAGSVTRSAARRGHLKTSSRSVGILVPQSYIVTASRKTDI
jgi:hypothetical protein